MPGAAAGIMATTIVAMMPAAGAPCLVMIIMLILFIVMPSPSSAAPPALCLGPARYRSGQHGGNKQSERFSSVYNACAVHFFIQFRGISRLSYNENDKLMKVGITGTSLSF